MIKVTTTPEAWELAYKLADAGEYELDKESEERAGYPIFREKNSYYSRICDLGCRVEIMKADGSSSNVWIEPPGARRRGGRTLWGQVGRENQVPDEGF